MTRDLLTGPGGPLDPVPDDTVCCYCGQELKRVKLAEKVRSILNQHDYQFHGFCDAACAGHFLIQQACGRPLGRDEGKLLGRAFGNFERLVRQLADNELPESRALRQHRALAAYWYDDPDAVYGPKQKGG